MSDEPYIPVSAVVTSLQNEGGTPNALALLTKLDVADVSGSESWPILLEIITTDLSESTISSTTPAAPIYLDTLARFYPDITPSQKNDLLLSLISCITTHGKSTDMAVDLLSLLHALVEEQPPKGTTESSRPDTCSVA